MPESIIARLQTPADSEGKRVDLHVITESDAIIVGEETLTEVLNRLGNGLILSKEKPEFQCLWGRIKDDPEAEEIETTINLFNPAAIIEGYIQNAIEKEENEEYFTTENIEIDPSNNNNLICAIGNDDDSLTLQNMKYALFVLDDGTFIVSEDVSSVEIPENAIYFVATFSNELKDAKLFIAYGSPLDGMTYSEYIAPAE